jgi:cell growth-regulating nucleolar protein
VAPSGGMRSWGSTPVNGSPVPESSVPAAFSATVNGSGAGEGEKKKKKKAKKGDKGGTGSKANSASKSKSESGDAEVEPAPKAETVIVAPGPPATTNGEEEPSAKKRKRDSEPSAPAVNGNGNGEGPSEKTLKRLRKNVSKLDSEAVPTTLSEFIGKVGKGKKDEVIGREEIMLGIKVVKVDGKWVLEV